jgi:cob(I)alamin adenosyltransferase
VKIYTKTGDGGETGLFAGPRVSKDDARIEAYGTVDELNAFLGLARAEGLSDDVDSIVERIQHCLFAVGAELASPDPIAAKTKLIGAAEISWIEEMIDKNEESLAPLRQFILPMGTRGAVTLHVARSVCRRAERRVITLRRCSLDPVGEEVVQYLNRLGDLLFVLARQVNALAGESDHPWEKPQPPI